MQLIKIKALIDVQAYINTDAISSIFYDASTDITGIELNTGTVYKIVGNFIRQLSKIIAGAEIATLAQE